MKDNDTIATTLSWYQHQAARTIAPLSRMEHSLHMLAGILTEIGEFTDLFKKRMAYGKAFQMSHCEEEWADAMWYMAGYKTPEDLNIEEVLYWQHSAQLHVSDASILIWLTRDIPYAYTNHLLKESSVEPLIAEWINLAEFIKLDWVGALHRNINKLKVRYPDKFDSVKAIDRNVDKEKEVL